MFEVARTDEIADVEFLNHILDGLSAEYKALNPKYFYDEQGSYFFDQICDLKEYYPYQAELSLLPAIAAELNIMLQADQSVVEFGAGAVKKIQPLLSQIESIKSFTAIDISGEHLRSACATLQMQFPNIDIHAVEADFCKPVELNSQGKENRLGFFPGSTIGNFTPAEARNFLSNAKQSLGANSQFLIGVDTKKSPVKLHHAYNDGQGITAQFNKNVLERINRELHTDIDVNKFEHYAFFNTVKGCIEMHLVSLEEQSFAIDGVEVKFDLGESIHTESSYKYSPKQFTALARNAGWEVEKTWLAEGDMFSVFLLSC